MLRNREVRGSNSGLKTSYPEVSRGFPQALEDNCMENTLQWTRPLIFIPLPIHFSQIIPPFYDV
jgi:hypothetical protein